MTDAEVRALLDAMLIPFDRFSDNRNADSDLTSAEIRVLLDIVKNFEGNLSGFDCNKALQDIAKIMGRFVNKAQVLNGKKISVNHVTMPFLIQQVLFYLAVRGMEHKRTLNVGGTNKPLTQILIIDKLKGYGINISHNFFSRLEMTPDYYLKMKTYEQKKVLFKYNGSKDKHLGVALKNLIYQAGKYENFVDIFGGSFAASVAFPRQSNLHIKKVNSATKKGYLRYVWNDFDTNLYNLFAVVKDKPKDLKAEIKALKADLSGRKPWLDIDFDAEITTFWNRCLPSMHSTDEKEIYDRRNADFVTDYDSIMKYMRAIQQKLEMMWEFDKEAEYVVLGVSYTLDELRDTFYARLAEVAGDKPLPTDSNIENYYLMYYLRYPDFLRGIAESLFIELKGDLNGSNISETASQDRFLQVRFYKYYAYFDNLLNGKTTVGVSDVRKALAMIYLNSLLTSGSVGVSSINRMLYPAGSGSKKNKSGEWLIFLNTDYEKIITDLSKVLAKTELENMDCIDLIQKYAKRGNNHLFYSDSPYLGTTGYAVNKKEGVSSSNGFTAENMRKLIQELFNSGSKFIFSCRACLEGISKDAKEGNVNLVKNVFEEFHNESTSKGVSLWVLTISKDGKKNFFNNLVANGDKAEVMICNFEITDFKDDKYPKAGYKVYRYDDFIVKLLAVLQH